MVSLVSNRISRSFSAKPLSSRVDPASACSWLLHPFHRTLYFSLLQLTRPHHTISPTARVSSGRQHSCLAYHPGLVWSANLVRVDNVPPFRPLLKVLNRTGFSLDPWGTLLGAGADLQLEFLQLITPWAWLFSLLSIHLKSELNTWVLQSSYYNAIFF